MADEIEFEGRVAVVTGAGNGLGRGYALAFAARGARVVVNDYGGGRAGDGEGAPADADRVVEEIRAAGGQAVASYESVATPEGGKAIVETALETYGTVDVVVNNAGILRDRSFAKLRAEDIDSVLDVHLRGAFFVTQPAYAVMRERGYGRLVFTTSGAGLFGNFGQANYSAAKAGLLGLSSTIAIEGAPRGIHSNVVAPVARTRMTEGLLGALSDVFDPEHVTPLVLYLASERCTLNHEVISAAGGRYARVFTAVAPGWFRDRDSFAEPEDIHEHLPEILSEEGYIVPRQAADEVPLLLDRIGAA